MTVHYVRFVALAAVLAGISAVVPITALALESTTVVEQQSTATDVFDKNSPAIVTIQTPSGFGSGVLVDSSGVIVTNLHVVEGDSSATVTLANGDIYDDVQVIAVDERRDIVIIKIAGFQLPTVEFGNSDAVVVGEGVYAIGSPQGLDLTISDGIISGKRRDPGDEGSQVLQTTAAISPGSSGGGLFDKGGRLIGITTSQMPDGESLSFAVPVNYVRGMLSVVPTMSLTELKAQQSSGVADSNAAAGASTTPLGSVPLLASAYTRVSGETAMVSQSGKTAVVKFSKDGVVYGTSIVFWDDDRQAFIGSGTLQTICGSIDNRIWDAPVQQELYVVNEGVIRERWSHPEKVNCDRQRVTESSWREGLWYSF